MLWFLLLAATAGASAAAGLILSRANPRGHWPWWGLPPARPWQYVASYFATVLLGMLSAMQGSEGGNRWLWALAVMILPMLVVRAVHHRGRRTQA